MDSYEDSARRRDKHRSENRSGSSSKSSSSKSHKQLINEHLSGDRESSYYKEASHHKRSRSRSRSRSRDKDRHKHKHHKQQTTESSSSTTRSTKYDESYANDSSQSYNNSYDNKYYPGTPSATVLMRQLPLYVTEQELRNELVSRNLFFKNLRLVKNRDTGTSRGFAFIEFNSIEDAQYWLESCQGSLNMWDAKVQLYYSQPKDDGKPGTNDWDCFKCGIKNFKRRDCCFRCNTTREDSEKMREGEGYEFIGTTPCNTLILRGLDALSSDETIRYTIATLTNVYVKNVYIVKDTLTSVSSGFAFVELNSIQEAGIVLQILQNFQPCFEIDGKQINADFSKNNFSTAIAQLSTRAVYPLTHYEPKSYNNQSRNGNTNQADQANSAAAVAQAALKNMQKNQKMMNQVSGSYGETTTNANGVTSIKAYVTPDISTYTYDDVSGYYYDRITGFYYDANSQYYYNSATQQYMYWDATSFSYIIVNNDQSTSTSTTTTTAAVTTTSTPAITTAAATYYPASTNAVATTPTVPEVADAPKPPETPPEVTTVKLKLNNAALIAKNMEKWAETMNKKAKKVVTTTASPSTPTTTTSSTTVASTIPTISNFINSDSKKEATSATVALAGINLTIQSQGASAKKVFEAPTPKTEQPQAAETAGESNDDEKKFIDYNKLACLLCKRGFDSVDLLNKHVQLSTLHKTNLEKSKQETQDNAKKEREKAEADSLLAAIQYRDRAKERRDKYGAPEPPFKADVRDRMGIDTDYPTSSYSAKEQSTASSAAASEPKSYDSIGSKLMRKMGWTDGSGLGKKNQGIAVPIEASIRQRGAGLGASGAQYDPNDSYKECVRKSARARFESLN